MLRFEWNGLRIGDEVLVHDWATDLTLHPGVVAFVDTHKHYNGVGIRLSASNGERTIQWPLSSAVHRDPRDLTEPCWECQALAERARQGERRVAPTT